LARITIPEVFRPALGSLASLPDEAAQELLSAIKRTAPVVNPKNMASRLAPGIESIPGRELADIMGALVALSSVRIVNRIAVHQFADDVSESLTAIKSFASVDLNALKVRLRSFLETEQIILAAKAATLQREFPNVFIGARVVSDIRPVFADGPESAQGAVVVHTLKVAHVQGNESREFFVVLDDEDLATLQKAISRAEAKSKTLKSLIQKAELVDLD